MAPVEELIVRPPEEVYDPLVYAPVPESVTDWGELTEVQNGVPA